MTLLFTGGFSDAFLQAVCHTLLHSLWQGIIAAVAAALIISFTKRSAAAVRYNLLVTLLCLFVVSITITAYHELQPAKKAESVNTAKGINIIPSLSVNFGSDEAMPADGVIHQNLLERLVVFCNDHASALVLIWFLFFLIKCGQLAAGLQHIQRLRHLNNHEAEPYWMNRLKELAQKTGVGNTILLLESELVKIPAAIGFLKPVILVPAGLLSNLPPVQVEAILMHELAHIRRRDFLVNLLQSFIETFFFFNPAIAWISSLIRQEREACCDDMVLAHIPQKASYLQALVSFQELHLHSKTGAMALTGNKQYLFNRVRRMLTLENKKLNLMEKTVLLFSIIGMTALGFITKEKKDNPVPAKAAKTETAKPVMRKTQVAGQMPFVKKTAVKEKKSQAPALPKQVTDTVPKTTARANENRSFPNISSNVNKDGNTEVSLIEATDDAGKTYRVKKIDGKITEFAVNGTIIPSSQYGEYDEVVRQIDEAQRQRILKKKEDIKLKQADMAAKRKDIQEKRVAMAKAHQKERNEKMKLRNETARKENLKRAEARKLFQQNNEVKRAEMNRKKVELARKQKTFNTGKKNNDDVGRIISDLNNHKLVTDEDNLSFNLTDKELVVNGKKQPAEIHRQFKEKYIQKTGDRFKYSKQGKTTNITINRE